MLVRGMSIVVLLLSKGASVSPFWWHVPYATKTHLLVNAVSCVLYFSDSRRIVWFHTGST